MGIYIVEYLKSTPLFRSWIDSAVRIFNELIPFREVPSNKRNHRFKKFYIIILWGAIVIEKALASQDVGAF